VIVLRAFCDGAEKFTPEAWGERDEAEWYLRQMLGTANFNRPGPIMRLIEWAP